MKDVIKTSHRADEIKTINGRKVRVNRRQRRNNMKKYYAVTTLFLTFVVMFLCLTVIFRAGEIKVDGVSLYREDQILNVGGISKGANLVRLDTKTIEERLKENLVYIDDVTVKKKYPSTIVVECKEAKKAADIKTGDSYSVVSSSGRILEKDNAAPNEDIPTVEGFDLTSKNVGDALESDDAKKTEALQNVIQAIEKTGLEGVTKIDISDSTDIRLFYNNKIEIKLSGASDIEYKLNYIKEVIKRLTDDYEGTLIYNGAQGGISAIPKENDSSKNDDSSKSDKDHDDSSANDSDIDSSSSAYQADTQWDTHSQAPQNQWQPQTQQWDDNNDNTWQAEEDSVYYDPDDT